jgi:hypothetical protein
MYNSCVDPASHIHYVMLFCQFWLHSFGDETYGQTGNIHAFSHEEVQELGEEASDKQRC